MSDSKYFTTTKKGEIHELKEELNAPYKVLFVPQFLRVSSFGRF